MRNMHNYPTENTRHKFSQRRGGGLRVEARASRMKLESRSEVGACRSVARGNGGGAKLSGGHWTLLKANPW